MMPFKFLTRSTRAHLCLRVCRHHNLYSLSRNFGVNVTFEPTTGDWPKYCFMMATGSGRTFVMALAIVWQYFNRFFGTQNGCRYTFRFLLIAPNLILLDRLCEGSSTPISPAVTPHRLGRSSRVVAQNLGSRGGQSRYDPILIQGLTRNFWLIVVRL
jgi:hypothetical protein